MDPLSFPAAIVASWIVVGVTLWGWRISKEIERTGKEPWQATVFVVVFVGLGVFGMWTDTLEHPFFYNLTSDLIGALIGTVSAYFLIRLASALRRALTQPQEPRR